MPESKNLSGLIFTFVLSIVGLALTPTVDEQVTNAAENLTGAAQTILELFPMFWVIMMIAIPIAAVVVWLRTD